jgi:CelD/BcsL family acetyltransferase involved in cellulose biosynthesis
MEVKRSDCWQDLEKHSLDWEIILRDSPELTIFSTPEWLGAWWKAFGQEKRMIGYSIANPNGEVIGLAPLYLEGAEARPFPAVRRLRMVGDGTEDSDNLDLIFRSGHEDACSNAFLDKLTSEKGWDICELNTLGSNSNVAQSMLSSLKQRGWPTRQWTRPGSIVRLPDTWEGYLKQLSSEHSGGIKRYTKRLARHYEVRIYKCSTEQELAPALEALFDLHQRRWHSQGKPGSFAGEERRHFYYEMSRGFLQQGWLELWVMELNGKPAAAQFAFRRGDIVYQLQEGLDPQHYTDRAGTVLRAHILKQLIAEGVRTYDFLGYVDAHKLSWGAQPGTYIDICFARPFSRGSLHLHVESRTRIAKQWFRSHLPEPVLRAIKRINPGVPG